MKLNNWEKLSYRRYYAKCGPLNLSVVRRGRPSLGYRWLVEDNMFRGSAFSTPEEAMAAAEEWFSNALRAALAAFRESDGT